jgi:argininosuccinate synthase
MVAHQTKADAVGHGATGKGNDQVRFEADRTWPSTPKLKIVSALEGSAVHRKTA